MSTNEQIYVDRPEGGSEPASGVSHDAKVRVGVSYDIVMGYDWSITGDGLLDIFAWRNQIRTRVASYERGKWLAVQRARNLR